MKTLFISLQRSCSVSQQLIALICTSWFLPPSNAPAQQSGIEQPCEFLTNEAGVRFIQWHGKPGRTYFIQISDAANHLGKWNYAPFIESGQDQAISHEVVANAEKGFFRLHYTDQAIPLGQTVATADFDGDGLTNSQEVEPPIPLVATNPLNRDTDGDGLSDGFERTYGFDPNDANPPDPSQGPMGDPDSDGLTNLAEAALNTNPNDPNSDDDTLDDGQDADPNDALVDWPPAPESAYVMVEVEKPAGFVGYAQDLNDYGQVLFPNHLWTAGTLLPLPQPSFSGLAKNPGEVYSSGDASWSFINNNERILGSGNTSYPEPWQHDPDQETVFIHDPNIQVTDFDFTKNIPMWDYGNLTLQPIGLTESGAAIAEFDYATYTEVGDPPEIQETLFHKLVVFNEDGTGDFSYLPMPNGYETAYASGYPSNRVTPSGWIATLIAATSQSSGAQLKVALWNPSYQLASLPIQADGAFEKINLTDLPNEKLSLTTASGSDLQTKVFLQDKFGNMQYTSKLSGEHLQTFAGDGTAMTSDGRLWRNGKFIPMGDLCPKFRELIDQGYGLLPLKGNKHGVYLIQAQGPNNAQKVFVLPKIEIKDNRPATGVDIVSQSAKTTDIGYQKESWIMAPAGTIPNTNLGCANDMRFIIPLTLGTAFKIECSNATPSPATIYPSFGNDPTVSWHGTTNNSSDETPVFKYGPNEQIVEAPIKVKVMKNRTVKVAVWPMNLIGEVGQTVPDSVKTTIREKLKETFSYQLNAWFDVEFKGGQEADYLDGSETTNVGAGMLVTIKYSLAGEAKEKAMISTFRDPAVDINVFLISEVDYRIAVNAYQLGISGFSYPPQNPATGVYRNSCVIQTKWKTEEEISATLAHEIGHLLVGSGHPDEWNDIDPVNSGGPAALQSLSISERKKRLMCSGKISDENSKLLVKKEWDKAEEWLVEFPDRRTNEQNN